MAQIRETELDVGALARALWRRAWLLVLLAGLAAAGTYYALGFVEPLYTADTSILIEQRESPLTRPREDGQNTTTVFDESAIQSQVEVLRSREIAEAVIDRLDLTRRPQFDPATAPSLIGSLSVLLGIEKHPVEATIRQRVMDSYFERLTVYPVQKSRVITVEFSAPTAALAAEVANAVAEAFADLQQDAKRESAVAATSWLEQEIDRLRERVAESEQEVADYRANNELFDVDSQSGSLSTQQLGDLNAELARARAARAEAEARAQLVEQVLAEGGSLETSQEVLDSALIQRLQERQVALGAQIAELSTTLLPAHPRIRALQGQLADLEGQIRQEGRKVQTSLNTAARVAAAREQSLLASLDDA
ncbi:MAG: GumC family protein [Rhizobiales bacterium]|nr:GumC family protein [Hyphomicrobiales bacterium]